MSSSHVDDQGQPKMVDISGKSPTARIARARARVRLPDEVTALFLDGDIRAPKGAVFHTALIAGVLAAKKTADLIPLCHPIGLDDCDIHFQLKEHVLTIESTCKVAHKTGVEMEALTAASVAALTVYDMCKGLSHEIVIEEIRLLEKHGGKSDYSAS